jgi:hypothetical protein
MSSLNASFLANHIGPDWNILFSRQSCMNNVQSWVVSSSKDLLCFQGLTVLTNLAGICCMETYVPRQAMH